MPSPLMLLPASAAPILLYTQLRWPLPPPRPLPPLPGILGRYLGNLQTEWSLDGDLLNFTGQPILMGGANSTSFIPADPVVVDLIDDYEGPVLAANKQVVGALDQPQWGVCGRPSLQASVCPLPTWPLVCAA